MRRSSNHLLEICIDLVTPIVEFVASRIGDDPEVYAGYSLNPATYRNHLVKDKPAAFTLALAATMPLTADATAASYELRIHFIRFNTPELDPALVCDMSSRPAGRVTYIGTNLMGFPYDGNAYVVTHPSFVLSSGNAQHLRHALKSMVLGRLVSA
jgi:hypothetical protein